MFRRRDFLMTMSALPWLPGLLRGAPLLQKSNRSLIVLWMDGGMSHIDTFDGKPEARPDIRGELCLLYTSPSPRDQRGSRMPSSA